MKKLILITILFTALINVNAQDLPPNPKTGECYIKCLDKEKGLSKWTKAPCDLVKKDSTQIKKIQQKLLNLGYEVETTGTIDIETIKGYKYLKRNRKKLQKK